MGHFAVALKAIMKDRGWSQVALAEKLRSVTQSTLSRYLVSDDLPKLVTLDEICRLLSQEEREEITAAFLTDQTPEMMGDSIRVVAVREGVEQPARYEVGRAPDGSDLKKALVTLERWGVEDSSVERVIIALADGYETRKKPVRYGGVREEGGGENTAAQDLADAERRLAQSEKGVVLPRKAKQKK